MSAGPHRDPGGGGARLLVLPAAGRRDLLAHAATSYPCECCGVLLGIAGEGGASVARVLPTANDAPGDRRDSYAIPPVELIAAQRAARAAGLAIVGYYHSHPDRAARPSRLDLEHAWPEMSYLIVAVAAGAVTELSSWRLRGDGEGFEPERLVAEHPGAERPE